MKGVLSLKYEGEVDYEKTIFYFKKEDVRSFYKARDTINVFLIGQGNITLDYEDELYERLERLFDA